MQIMIERNYIEFFMNLNALPTPEIALAWGLVMARGVVEYCSLTIIFKVLGN
jgi:hypothetical protein